MLRYAFRLHRWGLIVYAAIFFLSTYVQGAAYTQVAGTTAASRAAFAAAMGALAAQLSYLLPPAFHLESLAGYVQWRAFGPLALVGMVWAIASAAGAVRGDEDRQLVDYWLAARVSRVRLVVTRLATFALVALLAAAGAGLGALAGGARDASMTVGGAAGKSLALGALIVTLFALCFLVAQLVSSTRAAQATGTGVLLVLYLFDVAARTDSSLDGLAWVSPFRWYDATNVLAPQGHLDGAGLLLSAATILVAGGLSALAFTRRDVRGALFARPDRGERRREGAPSPLLRWPVASLFYRQRWVVAGWAFISVVMAVFMVGIAHNSINSLLDLPSIRAFLTHGAADPYQGFIAAFWFGIAELMLAGLAIHLVAGWAEDDTEGMLASILSMPVPRWAVIAERAATAIVALAVVVAAGSWAASLWAAYLGSPLDAGAVFRASWLLVPFGMTFAAVGAAASSLFPRAAVTVLGVLAFLSFLVSELGPLLNWPAWVTDLSVLQLYGTPFLTGVFWTGLWAMLAIVVVGFGLATLLMQRREVGV
jgi:ABC-2 type transport system permease protein